LRSKLRKKIHPHPIALRAIDLPPPGGGEESAVPHSHNPNIALAMMFFWISLVPP